MSVFKCRNVIGDLSASPGSSSGPVIYILRLFSLEGRRVSQQHFFLICYSTAECIMSLFVPISLYLA
jgi:hypothetical protein